MVLGKSQVLSSTAVAQATLAWLGCLLRPKIV